MLFQLPLVSVDRKFNIPPGNLWPDTCRILKKSNSHTRGINGVQMPHFMVTLRDAQLQGHTGKKSSGNEKQSPPNEVRFYIYIQTL